MSEAAATTAFGPANRRRQGWVVWALAGAWTLLVGLALWWSWHGAGGQSVWIVHRANALSPGREAFRGWFNTGISPRRIYPWLLLAPYVVLVAWRFPLERGRLWLHLPLNLAVGAVFLAASHAVDVHTRTTVANVTIIGPQVPKGTLRTNTLPGVSKGGADRLLVQLRRNFAPPSQSRLWPTLMDLLAYCAVLGFAHSVHFYRRFRERERRALLLESSLAVARLNALRAQLQPHFLFNSLNAIAALLRSDPQLAEATLLSLSELLRFALSQSEKSEIPLGEELEFTRRYLEIQQTRFGDKLRVEREIDPAALDCLVPTLVLQPLVENAIRHGIEPAEGAGLVRLSAQHRQAALVLTVEDNGVGLMPNFVDAHGGEPNGGARTGIGLANLRARLQTLYGAGQKVELLPRLNGGVSVRVEIPWKPSAAPTAASACRVS